MFAELRLLPMSDRDKHAEILALRHQLAVLERQLGTERVKLAPEDRAFLAALLVTLPRQVLRRLRRSHSALATAGRPGCPDIRSCGGDLDGYRTSK
ncbi:hypothetical protein [Streptomyces sp. NPDC021622]|uniref:hypothetical protein n=1 Tax=Streptomyces sp. NPDC021622 TaxID=3155013 RepID=UPI0033CD430D